jgi:hypothetical protein
MYLQIEEGLQQNSRGLSSVFDLDALSQFAQKTATVEDERFRLGHSITLQIRALTGSGRLAPIRQ